jgi:CubicO group peptidase (beta-lactamase class C family)
MRFPGRRGWAVLGLSVLALTGCASADSSGVAATSSAPDTGGHARLAQVRAVVDAMFATDDRGVYRRLRSILVSVNGEVAVEQYRDSTATTTLKVHSITKSVMATLVGIAIDEGRIKGVDQTLEQLLPTYVDAMSPATRAITLKQVLTMTAGLSTDSTPFTIRTGSDWVRDTLHEGPVGPVGAQAEYSNAGAHLVAAIVQQATGQTPLEYARAHLFTPLAINSTQSRQLLARPEDLQAYQDQPGFGWLADPTGLQIGSHGLKLTGRDLLALGQLWLDNGQTKGRQVVSASWVQQATSKQVTTPDGGGYGYLFWMVDAHGHPGYVAVGLLGQIIEVVPDLHLVVVVQSASSVDDSAPLAPGTADSFEYVDLVNTAIAPTLG